VIGGKVHVLLKSHCPIFCTNFTRMFNIVALTKQADNSLAVTARD